jgi:quercetin 2,3-dioxygenase
MKDFDAIIYLAENRNCFQTEAFRSLITLPSKNVESSFDSIIKFADNTLSAKQTSTFLFEGNQMVILLPLVGAIEIFENEKSKIVNSGEIAHIFRKKNEQIIIQNPYENDLINYLEIWMNWGDIRDEQIIINTFDLEKNENKLIEIPSQEGLMKIYIGKYGGREEDVLSIKNNAFVFVINGVFEVQNRLLESRTGLSLLQIEELEFEGLAQENIILIISE